jgi:hypothetical protein
MSQPLLDAEEGSLDDSAALGAYVFFLKASQAAQVSSRIFILTHQSVVCHWLTPSTGEKVTTDYGTQRIGLFQSTCLLVNNVTGAAMVLYPTLLQQAGWFTPVSTMLVVASLSAIAGLCLIKTMQLIPQNEHFQQRYEYTNIVQHFCSVWEYRVIFTFFMISMFAGVAPLIIQSAQAMDFMLVAAFGKSCGALLGHCVFQNS